MGALAVINVIALMAIAFGAGYALAKGRLIVVEQTVKLSQEQQEKLERMEREQEEAIERYNTMVKSLSSYMGSEVI